MGELKLCLIEEIRLGIFFVINLSTFLTMTLDNNIFLVYNSNRNPFRVKASYLSLSKL